MKMRLALLTNLVCWDIVNKPQKEQNDKVNLPVMFRKETESYYCASYVILLKWHEWHS